MECWSGAATVMNPFRHRLKTGWNLNACQCETACACKVFAVYPTGAADASWLIEESLAPSLGACRTERVGLSVEALICKANTILIDSV